MKTYRHLYSRLCSWENLYEAYQKAKKRKHNSIAVKKFDENWRLHLCQLLRELRTQTYQPKPLQKFVLRDPKTRVICVSDFRDRVVHHALVNILQPIFEPRFIYDSYASRKGKGTLLALRRADTFIRKVSKNGMLIKEAKNNNQVQGYALKCDIRHYFDAVDQQVLLDIISRRIKDQDVLWLIKTILNNYNSDIPGKGMPLGNWTSQFFANVYLNELDQFVKNKLGAKYYLRYVDDFVIFHPSKDGLKEYEQKIKEFLPSLKVELHPDKCRIILLRRGMSFLGFRLFYHYKLLRKRNLHAFQRKMSLLFDDCERGNISTPQLLDVFQGWKGYALMGNSYHLCQKMEQDLQCELAARTPNKLSQNISKLPPHSFL